MTSSYIPNGFVLGRETTPHWTNYNNHLTHHRPSFSFGHPPSSNMYMVFNGRLSAPMAYPRLQPIQNSLQRPEIFQNPHSVHRYMIGNILNSGAPAHIDNYFQPVVTPQFLPQINYKRTGSFYNNLPTTVSNFKQEEDQMKHVKQSSSKPTSYFFPNVKTAETIATTVPNPKTDDHHKLIKPSVNRVTPYVLPHVTLNVAGNVYDTIPTTLKNIKEDEEHLKLVKQAIEFVRSEDEENNPDKKDKPTSLVLKPIAKAVAGIKGVAIAAPISRAIVRKGQEVNIHFDPQAVAVVGPGGVADAHSDLVISYLEDLKTPQTEKPKV